MNHFTVSMRVFVLLIFTGSALFSCDTERNVENPDLHYFVKYYGGDGNQEGVDMEVLSDGSLLLLGNSLKSNLKSDAYVVHVDSEGKVISERTFSIGDADDGILTAKDLEPAGDGNFIVLVDYREAIGNLTQISLLKISPDGILLDSVGDIGTVANDFSHSVTLLDDGGFIVTGTTELTATYNLANNPDPDLGDFFNYRLDGNLDLLPLDDWSPISPGFGGKLDVAVRTIQYKNGFYVFGFSNTDLSGNNPDKLRGFFYFRRGSEGGPSNPYFAGNAPNRETDILDVQKIPSQLGGGALVTGTSRDKFGDSNIIIVRMRDTLVSNISIDASLYSIIPIARNIHGVSATTTVVGSYGYAVLGDEIRSTGTSNIWVTKIDQSGSVLWSSTFGSEIEEDSGAAVRELPDGKIVILGTISLADNQSKMALIKVNSSGQLLK